MSGQVLQFPGGEPQPPPTSSVADEVPALVNEFAEDHHLNLVYLLDLMAESPTVERYSEFREAFNDAWLRIPR